MENVVPPAAGQRALPLHPPKVEPPDGVAESVTVAPAAKLPPPATEPVPVPLTLKVTGKEVGVEVEVALKVAVQVRAAAGIVRAVESAVGQAAFPLQPANVDPVLGMAESVTMVPAVYVPAPLTVPLPLPALVRVSANETGVELSVKVAVQVMAAAGITRAVFPAAGQAAFPLQPAKVDPALATAATVTMVPAA